MWASSKDKNVMGPCAGSKWAGVGVKCFALVSKFRAYLWYNIIVHFNKVFRDSLAMVNASHFKCSFFKNIRYFVLLLF